MRRRFTGLKAMADAVTVNLAQISATVPLAPDQPTTPSVNFNDGI